jgi:uncharacterized protein YlxP (DUF503 family)
MLVGVCTAVLRIPGAASLKDKRRAVKSLKDRLHNTFNLSVAEVDDLDLWQRATLGLAVVSNDAKHCDEVLSAAVDFIRRDNNVELLDYHTEIQ